MKIDWEDKALQDIEEITFRAPRTARRVVDKLEWLVGSPFPGMFRKVKAWQDQHVCSIPPYVALYVIRDDYLIVTGVEDTRRIREPW
ncbi:MAG: type II toxin-antitoxin system RelE/ParE family toxin [Candidatus Dormibacteraceae bacterium]